MTTQIEKNEKAEVTEYFNGTGFDRWNRIYSESDDVNKVQKNIRIGHQKTVDDVISWLKEYDNIKDKSFCDAGCGVGSLSIPLIIIIRGITPQFIPIRSHFLNDLCITRCLSHQNELFDSNITIL